MPRVLLIRHAEPRAAWGGADGDPALSEKGQAQAERLAEDMARLGAFAVVSSPMRRCRETAAPYAARVGEQPRIEPRVSEVAAPLDVTDRPAWLRANFPWAPGVPRKTWEQLDPALATWRDDAVRAIGGLRGDTAMFTHFIAINAIVGAVLGQRETIVCLPGHGSITELAVDEDGMRVVRLGEEMRSDDVR
jgi:broad specificity phosphatase PhoE